MNVFAQFLKLNKDEKSVLYRSTYVSIKCLVLNLLSILVVLVFVCCKVTRRRSYVIQLITAKRERVNREEEKKRVCCHSHYD